jgi:Restriction endonuclease fold toxin 5
MRSGDVMDVERGSRSALLSSRGNKEFVGRGGAFLKAGGVVIRPTPVGYVCAGLGSGGRLLQAAFADRELATLLDKATVETLLRCGINPSLVGIDDPPVRRLAILTALAKDFDPDQPRDEQGRWTSEGAASAFVARTTVSSSSFLGRVAPSVLEGLVTIAARATAVTAFFGIIFIPTNRSLVQSGTLPDRPDVNFEYNYDGDILTLWEGEGANSRSIFRGRPDAEGVIRDKVGHAVGRKLSDGSIIIDPDAVPDTKGSGDATDDKNEPKLCPDREPDKPGRKTEQSIAYQTFIGTLNNPHDPLPPGLAVTLSKPSDEPVYFDDCRQSDGTMLEAKGPGYSKMLHEDSVMPWKGVQDRILRQADDQLQAAGKRPIEWYFHEKDVADYVRELFEKRGITIQVIYKPMPGQLSAP